MIPERLPGRTVVVGVQETAEARLWPAGVEHHAPVSPGTPRYRPHRHRPAGPSRVHAVPGCVGPRNGFVLRVEPGRGEAGQCVRGQFLSVQVTGIGGIVDPYRGVRRPAGGGVLCIDRLRLPACSVRRLGTRLCPRAGVGPGRSCVASVRTSCKASSTGRGECRAVWRRRAFAVALGDHQQRVGQRGQVAYVVDRPEQLVTAVVSGDVAEQQRCAGGASTAAIRDADVLHERVDHEQQDELGVTAPAAVTPGQGCRYGWACSSLSAVRGMLVPEPAVVATEQRHPAHSPGHETRGSAETSPRHTPNPVRRGRSE